MSHDYALEYLKERYQEELARFEQIESKSARIVAFTPLLAAAIAAICAFNDYKILSPTNPIEWITLTIFGVSFIAATFSWMQALSVLKVTDCTCLPNDRDTFEYIENSEPEEVEAYLRDCYKDTIEKMAAETNSKSDHLDICYTDITVSATSLLCATILLILQGALK